MTVSISGTKSQFEEAATDPAVGVRLKVTGVDVKGQMFRHSATVLMLDGRDCAFRSDSQPELAGSVLVEFDYPEADPKRRLSQARVISNEAEIESGFYRVVVELEIAQKIQVFPKQSANATKIEKLPLPTVPASPAASQERKVVPVVEPVEFHSLPKPTGMPQALPRTSPEVAAPITIDSREPLSKPLPQDPIEVREAAKSAVASEIKQQITQLKSWISSELERSLPVIASSMMEKMIAEGLEKQVSVNRESFIQALNVDVARQVGDRIAENKDLRNSLENMAKKLFEEQTQLSRSAGIKVEQELGSRAASIIASFEESAAGMEAKMNNARLGIEAALTKSQALRDGIDDEMLRLEAALQQLTNAEKVLLEKIQNQAASQLNTRVVQFADHLTKISTDTAAQFLIEMETHLAPHHQRADELIEKLGAIFQLLQNTARVQQERLAEYSQTTAANFEKEIRAVLLRLGGAA